MKKILDSFYLSDVGGAYTTVNNNFILKSFKNGGLIIKPEYSLWNAKTNCRIENLYGKPRIVLDSNNILEMIVMAGVSKGGIINDKFSLEFDSNGLIPRLVSESYQSDYIKRVSTYTEKILNGPKSKKLIPGHLYGTPGSYFLCLGYKLPLGSIKKSDGGYFKDLWSSYHTRMSWKGDIVQSQEKWNLTLEIPEHIIDRIPFGNNDIPQLSSTILDALLRDGANLRLRLDSFYRKAADLGEAYTISNVSKIIRDSIAMDLSLNLKASYSKYHRILFSCAIYYAITSDLSQLKNISGLKSYIKDNFEELGFRKCFDAWFIDKL